MGPEVDGQLDSRGRAHRLGRERRLAVAGFLCGATLGALAGLFKPNQPERETPPRERVEPWRDAMPRRGVRAVQRPA
jgi:hypothetical protein